MTTARLTVQDVASALGVRPDVVRGLIRDGLLRARRKWHRGQAWQQATYVYEIRQRALTLALEDPRVLRVLSATRRSAS